MLTQLRCPVRWSFASTDFLLTSDVETVGTLYQKDGDPCGSGGAGRFHLVLTEPLVLESDALLQTWHNWEMDDWDSDIIPTPRLLWLEFSPYRVTLTMQGNGQFSYRHWFEPHVFGISRYWLQDSQAHSAHGGQMQLRNFTRFLHVKGSPLPRYLRLEYELWAPQLKLGDYSLSVEIGQD